MSLTARDLVVGDWVELGRFPQDKRKPAPILWRSAGNIRKHAVLISAYVLTNQPFDDPRRGYENGDNRWSECTLRTRLNHRELGLLSEFSDAEVDVLEPVELKTEVCSSYQADRKKSTDTTTDTVWIATWEEYKKLPKEVQGAVPSAGFLRKYKDFALDAQPHWSRSAFDGLGCGVLHLPFKEKAKCNSDAASEWGIRPLIALRADVALTGDGSERSPYRLT